MARSIFATPIITPFCRLLANTWLKLSGWRVITPSIPKRPFVCIGAPHTSNWDFLLLLVVIFHLRLDIRWIGKHTLFPPILGHIMKWMGGIPVNRTKAHNVVAKMAHLLQHHPDTILCIMPEGTRKRVTQWKTGFYRIAEEAGTPILMAAIDADKKQLLVLGEFYPSGNMDRDLKTIQGYYHTLRGLRPENSAK